MCKRVGVNLRVPPANRGASGFARPRMRNDGGRCMLRLVRSQVGIHTLSISCSGASGGSSRSFDSKHKRVTWLQIHELLTRDLFHRYTLACSQQSSLFCWIFCGHQQRMRACGVKVKEAKGQIAKKQQKLRPPTSVTFVPTWGADLFATQSSTRCSVLLFEVWKKREIMNFGGTPRPAVYAQAQDLRTHTHNGEQAMDKPIDNLQHTHKHAQKLTRTRTHAQPRSTHVRAHAQTHVTCLQAYPSTKICATVAQRTKEGVSLCH